MTRASHDRASCARRLSDVAVQVPKILQFPRLETTVAMQTMQGMVLSAVGALKLACEAGVTFLATAVIILHFIAALLAIAKVRSGVNGKLAKFQYYDMKHRKLLFSRMRGHLREAVVRSSQVLKTEAEHAKDEGGSDSVTSDHTSRNSSRGPRFQPAKLAAAYTAYKETRKELAEFQTELTTKGEWVVKDVGETKAGEDEVAKSHASGKADSGKLEHEFAVKDAKAKKVLEEKKSAKRFINKYGHFFEDYDGPNWWFFFVVLSEKLLVAIVTPAFSAATLFPGAQVSILLAVQIVYLVLLIWRRPFVSHMDNVHNIITKANHVLVYCSFFAGTMNMMSSGENEVAQSASSVATFATTFQMLGTLHLMVVQASGIYSSIPKGAGRGCCKLCGSITDRILLRKRNAETPTASLKAGDSANATYKTAGGRTIVRPTLAKRASVDPKAESDEQGQV